MNAANSSLPAAGSAAALERAHDAAVLARLSEVIASRRPAAGGDPETSYVARLLLRGPDAFLKKIGEEAAEVVMAAKDAEHGGAREKLVGEMADLWFHGMVALAHFDLSATDVVAELARREGLSGLDEQALRKARARDAEGAKDARVPTGTSSNGGGLMR